MRAKTSRTIWIGKNAYLFLDEEERKQRGCKPLSNDQKEKLWERLKKSPRFRNGQYNVYNNSFGGGDGTYNGRWRSWPVEEIIRMLEKNGLEYQNGEEMEYIEV